LFAQFIIQAWSLNLINLQYVMRLWYGTPLLLLQQNSVLGYERFWNQYVNNRSECFHISLYTIVYIYTFKYKTWNNNQALRQKLKFLRCCSYINSVPEHVRFWQ
jgi:hypothetical protein